MNVREKKNFVFNNDSFSIILKLLLFISFIGTR